MQISPAQNPVNRGYTVCKLLAPSRRELVAVYSPDMLPLPMLSLVAQRQKHDPAGVPSAEIKKFEVPSRSGERERKRNNPKERTKIFISIYV
ncbi:hypothetical protein PUN28_005277 [Cardiocondyla obscurior]|uniref:Uncharacterized protein n=1 Tax=Cardiocondyla obscurior TaxID=286306 RepID=A0AAW2GIZ9_9HYME